MAIQTKLFCDRCHKEIKDGDDHVKVSEETRFADDKDLCFPCWVEWQKVYARFFRTGQRS